MTLDPARGGQYSTRTQPEDHPIPTTDPEVHSLVQTIARAANEKKASEVVILDVRGRTSYCDYFVLCNGENPRQVAAIAEQVIAEVKRDRGLRPLGSEGLLSNKWVLVDFGDVLVHVFLAHLRGYYDIDGLWMDAPKVPVEDAPAAETAPGW